MPTLAQAAAASPVWLASILKPLVMFGVLTGWAYLVGWLDKDAAYFYLQRQRWNLVHIGCGILAFALWLLMPGPLAFWLGLPVALVILGGGIAGYALYRNTQVREHERWSFSLESFTRKVEQMQQAQVQRRALLHMMTKDEGILPVPAGEDPAAAAHQTLESVLEYALARGADRIDVAVDAQRAVIAVRIDGVKYPQPTVEPRVALALVDYLKQNAKLDLQDRRRKQTGFAYLKFGETGNHSLELSTQGSTRSVTLTAAIDPKQLGNIPLDKLGLLPGQLQPLRAALAPRGHVVIATSPSGNGMTTTLYALIQSHDPYTQSVIAYEEEKAFDLEGVNHELRPPGTPPEQVNDRLAAMLRTDPDVVMLDALADGKTATLLAKSAEDIRFYFGLPQPDTFAALKTWKQAVGKGELAADALGAIVACRLVRKLCPVCRVAYTPDADALRKLNLPADRVAQLYRASGKVAVGKDKEKPCDHCFGIGYRGRTAIFEVLALDDEGRRLAAADNLDALRGHLRKQKMLYLQEAALARVVEGATDIKEVTRALAEK